MPAARIVLLTAIAMIAFASNSLLCRVALKHTAIDPASFTTVRLVSGALALWLIVRLRSPRLPSAAGRGNWLSALALYAYAAGFSFAYVNLAAASGALLLFGAVQATMIGRGIAAGERLAPRQWAGLLLALAGLVGMLLPGLTAPPLAGALLMMGAGVAWGVYSLRGKGAGDATSVTAGNFVRAAPIAVAMSAAIALVRANGLAVDGAGLLYAVASGALTSGIGYAIWYAALPGLRATSAATVQLSVPVIAALGGVAFLGEALTVRLVAASVAILGGIALVILKKRIGTTAQR
ncbi:DMT family transporter [Rugamonas apoptosis]|uniref:DMT family transporter n=1 Tax=Rugamonas apoptosis TaxID=2758570 RepID=A0A7W2FBJ9_9BURK|nr:DMT family transporter [Rugamonas apoptosis]MBA5688721.1 DMT family transporter [Rugamonas apoptosis]